MHDTLTRVKGNQTAITDLVRGFAENLARLGSPEYKESQARLHYIDPFWTALGWDVSNADQRPPQDVDVIVEPSMDSIEDTGLATRKPDYVFRHNGFPRFIVEAKKPATDLDDDKEAIFQTKRYAWSAALPFAVLTNFKQFRLFDTALKPILNEPSRGLIDEFALDFENYPAQWDVLLETFGREAVAGGSLEQLRGRIRRIRPGRRLRTPDRMLLDLRGDEPVDKVFLGYLETYRRHFATAIYRENKKAYPDADTLHGAARLTETVQRLIDRIVFMRVCEDRGISKWGGLRETLDQINAEGGDLYPTLVAQFRQLDREYNGYLFKVHSLSETIKVPDAPLADFITNLYPPDGPWDFSAIGDEILGIVYERFLGNVVTVRDRQIVIEEKPEVRHAGGVYYTPRFVVDTIIRRVVGPKIAGKSPVQVLDVKILDPACGSGSFLVAAFQYLMDHCLSAIAADPSLATVPASPRARKKRKEIAFMDEKGVWHLAPDFKAAILTNCLHGVDIDQQAVEVTVMSLYLKMLEGTLPPNWQRDWLERELLPPLDNNIQCGNSLIDSESFDAWLVDKHGGLFPLDEDIRFRINRFDWTSRTRGFGRLLDDEAASDRGRKGFDCIIGNPPYIRVQELNKWAPQECEFYKWKYKSAKKGNYDIYVVFTERALQLLSPDGLLGFIMPHKFWQAKYGEGLRKVIADGKHLQMVVDFTHELVFPEAAIYTAVQVFGRFANKDGKVAVSRIEELSDGPAQVAAADSGRRAPGVQVFQAEHPKGSDAWSLVPPERGKLLAQTRAASATTLGKIAVRMAQGIRTSMNPVYVLRAVAPNRNLYYSEHLDRQVELESGLLRPFLGAEHIRRYEVVPNEQVVLIPYESGNGKNGGLVALAKLKADYPLTLAYLRACEKSLRGREHGKMNREGWYGFVYPKNLTLIDEPKVLVPDIVEEPSFALDAKGGSAFVSGYAITLPGEDADTLWYLTGLLNSKLLGAFLKDISTPLRGGWYRPFPQFMEQLPIKIPETADEKRKADRITESVRAIMAAKTKLRGGTPPLAGVRGGLRATVLSDRETRALESEVEAHERRIDEAVFQLYGVDSLPEG